MAEQKLNEDLRAAQQDLEEAQRILANQEIAFKKEIATLTERLADAQADKADAERSLSDATLYARPRLRAPPSLGGGRIRASAGTRRIARRVVTDCLSTVVRAWKLT